MNGISYEALIMSTSPMHPPGPNLKVVNWCLAHRYFGLIDMAALVDETRGGPANWGSGVRSTLCCCPEGSLYV